MVKAPVSLVLVGIGGMGAVYVRELLDGRESGQFRIAGAVDPEAERCPLLEELRSIGVPVFSTLDGFYRNRTAELAVISSPIQFHSQQTCLALAKGSHVLCEKPVAGTIREARRMIEAEKDSDRRVSVGYQWSFSPAIQALKRDITDGRFGEAKRLKCLYLWPRDEKYFRRNAWAGKKRDAAGGWILDSPAQNAMAHDLHNMFYVLGKERDSSAAPVEVEAELYRANPIENYDTTAMRARTGDGVEILLYATHVPREERGPIFFYEFEKAVVRCSSRTSGVWAEFGDGSRKDYGVPDAEGMNKLWESIRNVRTGQRPTCGLEAASSQTLCVNGMQDSMPEIRDFPEMMRHVLEENESRRIWVEGLDDALEACYAANALPSELGVAWSAKGRLINLGTQYQFPNSAGN
jgi:predicted dehydrogenase